MQNKAIKPKIT